MKSLLVTEQAVNMEIPKETCTHDLKKMFIYSIIKKKKGKMYLTNKLMYKNVSHQKLNTDTLSAET